MTFSTAVGRDATFHTGLRTTGRTTYAIEWQRETSRRVLAHGAVEGPTSIACAYPTGTGVISLISDHPVTWVDPRVVRDLSLWPTIWALGLLVLAWLARGAGLTRRAAFRVVAATVSVAAAIVVSEVALRALGDSFTDAMTMAAEAAWPAQLEQTLGVPRRRRRRSR